MPADGVVVDHDVLNGEAGTGKQVEVRRADLDLAVEPSLAARLRICWP